MNRIFNNGFGSAGIRTTGSNVRQPIIKHGTNLDSLRSKMVSAPIQHSGTQHRTADGTAIPDQQFISEAVNVAALDKQDAENIRQMLPDIKLAEQVLISSILSPRDMIGTSLSFSSDLESLAELKTSLINEVEDYFKKTYKIEAKLPQILEEVLFTSGAKTYIVLPETSVDAIINGKGKNPAMESFQKEFGRHGTFNGLGVLANPRTEKKNDFKSLRNSLSIESATKDFNSRVKNYDPKASWDKEGEYFTVIDNINALKMPHLVRHRTELDLMAIYGAGTGIGFEDAGSEYTSTDGRIKLYRERQYEFTPVIQVDRYGSRDTEGHPIVIEPPTEAIIPVHIPGNPEDQVGFYMVLDQTGHPLSLTQHVDHYRNIVNAQSLKGSMPSDILQRANQQFNGQDTGNQQYVERVTGLFQDMVEKDLISRLESGIYSGTNVAIAKRDDVFRIMLARACAHQQTQLLYIPKNLATYIAFDYNAYGLGQSLLAANKLLASIRSLLLMSNSMAAVSNATNHRKLNVTLSENDPDPSRTLEMIFHEFAKRTVNQYPLGSVAPQDQLTFLASAGIQAAVTNHPGWPDTQVELEHIQTNAVEIDTEFAEDLKKQHLMSMGISPETVDLSMNVEFATSIVSSNILLAKRAMLYQEKLCGFLIDHIRKFTLNSETLMTKLKNIIDGNRDKITEPKYKDASAYVIALQFVASLNVSLPTPELSRLDMQMAAFNKYSEYLDSVIPAFISSEILTTDNLGDTVGQNVDEFQRVFKAHLLRRWLEQENVLPEIFDMFEKDPDGNMMFEFMEVQEAYQSSFSSVFGSYLRKRQKRIEDHEKTLEQDGVGGEDDGFSSSDDGGFDDDTDDTSLDDDFTDDLGSDDESTTESTDSSNDEDDEPDNLLADSPF